MEQEKEIGKIDVVTVREWIEQLRAHWIILCVIVLLAAVIGGVIGKVNDTPQYVSQAKLLVYDNTSISSSELDASKMLSADYIQIIRSNTVLQRVLDRLDMADKHDVGYLKKIITCTSPENTRVINLGVTTGDPKKSQRIAEAVCDIAQVRIAEIMNNETVGIDSRLIVIDSAGEATRKSSDWKLGIWIGLGCGVFLAFIAWKFFCANDDKIKNEDDVKKCLEIGLLAEIPYVAKKASNTPSRSNKKS